MIFLNWIIISFHYSSDSVPKIKCILLQSYTFVSNGLLILNSFANLLEIYLKWQSL